MLIIIWWPVGMAGIYCRTIGGTAGGVSVGATATDGNWHHVAFTWQQGVLVASNRIWTANL